MPQKNIRVTVFRYNPKCDGQPHYETYQVQVTTGTSVLNVLQYISENYDGGLSYYTSCRIGVCRGCVVRVNGKPRLACTELATGDMVIEPASSSKVVKDLLLRSSEKLTGLEPES
ncbi:MAG: 2Fe-2S iron-sulfur cluster-binding protein [Chloroflexi bacterium]|nr:2Fe-2S iron-sulfur cluster-binding protein [Chloroflexota bacterium]MCL5075403.1 2Fe-2S iron-sulfur cluster-binding protein [Chloroflexota bacterium]